MEFELKEVPTITLEEDLFKNAVMDLSSNALKLFISVAILHTEDWYKLFDNNTINETYNELVSKGYMKPKGEGHVLVPDFCVNRGTIQSKFVKNYMV